MNKRVKILLADDDPEDRFIMSDSFREIGVEDIFYFVEDGEEVLKYLNVIQEKEDLPTLIVLDLNMPRLNGRETLIALKENPSFAHIPVVIFSTSVNEVEKQICMENGAEKYVPKPVSYKDTLETAHLFYQRANIQP